MEKVSKTDRKYLIVGFKSGSDSIIIAIKLITIRIKIDLSNNLEFTILFI